MSLFDRFDQCLSGRIRRGSKPSNWHVACHYSRRALEALRADGLTILLVEQKLDIALALAARAYVMVKGSIVLEGAAGEILGRPDLGELYFSVSETAA